MKKCIFLVTLTVLLSMAGPASAETLYRAGPGQVSEPPSEWDWDAEVSSAWGDGNNWVAFIWPGPPPGAAQPILPTSADTVHLNRGPTYPVLIDSGTSAAAGILNVGFWDSLDVQLDVTGGTLDVVDRLSVGTAGSDVHGYMDVFDGAITVGGPLVVGGQDPYGSPTPWGSGNGSLTMYGGTVTIISGNLQVGAFAGTGDLTLRGGTITLNSGTLDMTENGWLAVRGNGMLILPGDQTDLIDDYIDFGWLSGDAEFYIFGPYAGKTVVISNVIEVPIDIKPPSCPNPINVNNKGVLSVAIVGSEELDVTTIDVASIRLEGVAPVNSELEDVTTPADGGVCACTDAGPDGYLDLTVRFPTQEIVGAIGAVSHGETLVLTLTGELSDDSLIEGIDCVRIKTPRAKRPPKVK
jgi:hypothetical protein